MTPSHAQISWRPGLTRLTRSCAPKSKDVFAYILGSSEAARSHSMQQWTTIQSISSISSGVDGVLWIVSNLPFYAKYSGSSLFKCSDFPEIESTDLSAKNAEGRSGREGLDSCSNQ